LFGIVASDFLDFQSGFFLLVFIFIFKGLGLIVGIGVHVISRFFEQQNIINFLVVYFPVFLHIVVLVFEPFDVEVIAVLVLKNGFKSNLAFDMAINLTQDFLLYIRLIILFEFTNFID